MLVFRSTRRWVPATVLSEMFVIAFAAQSYGIILSRFNPADPLAQYNTTAPTDDPGWYNVSSAGSSYLYLGDQWFLTADHVGGASPTVSLANGQFTIIPGTNVQLTNPAGNFHQINSDDEVELGPLTSDTDLRLFRVNTDPTTGLRPEDLNPGIKPISIASNAPTVGTSLVMMGIGNDRTVNENDVNQQGLYHYDVNTNTDPWTWPSGAGANSGGNFFGFRNNGPNPRQKRWGTNEVSPDSQIEDSWEIGNDANNYVVTTLNSSGIDVVSLIARFDQLGPNSDESMASAGDSGGPVFSKDAGGQWQLAGIMNAIILFSGQHASRSIYGNWTSFADLSNPHYYQQIADLRAQSNYSIMGDINLDGIVSGDGTGAWASDDVTAFIQGWLNIETEANILSWKQGDLNQDGVTDLSDFALLRTALGGTINNPEVEAFFGSGTSAVPEPASWLLMLGIWSGLMWLFRRRRLATVPVHRRS